MPRLPVTGDVVMIPASTEGRFRLGLAETAGEGRYPGSPSRGRVDHDPGGGLGDGVGAGLVGRVRRTVDRSGV